jgi:very-short-patch-repair endonuclease
MNPIIRHFLPSVIRGVYRYDDDFSSISDEESFSRFIEGKLKFLPSGVSESICRGVNLNHDFRIAQRQRTLPGDLLESGQTTAPRAKAFFRRHRYFDNALNGDRLATDADLKDAKNFLEIQFVKKVLVPLLSEKGLSAIQPQRNVGPYFVDFALEGATKLALEVDGFGKFKARQDLDDFIKRQNYITSQGWRVIRFTFGQVMESTGVTLRDLHNLLKADSELRRFLAIQWHTGFLRPPPSSEAGKDAIDLVNDFYRVQDWFIQSILTDPQIGRGARRP